MNADTTKARLWFQLRIYEGMYEGTYEPNEQLLVHSANEFGELTGEHMEWTIRERNVPAKKARFKTFVDKGLEEGVDTLLVARASWERQANTFSHCPTRICRYIANCI